MTGSEQQREGPWLVVAALCVIGSPGAAYAAQQSSGWRVGLWFFVQLLLTGCAFLIPQARQLGAISVERDPGARSALVAQAIPFVLNAAAGLIGTERSRACWFELTDESPPRLVPQLSVGRTGSPTTTFERGTAAGDATLDMVLAGDDRLCRDIATEPPPGWDADQPRDYRTFISVSVTAGDTAFGMLTLDALVAGDLTVDDLHMLGLMAAALAQRPWPSGPGPAALSGSTTDAADLSVAIPRVTTDRAAQLTQTTREAGHGPQALEAAARRSHRTSPRRPRDLLRAGP